MGPYVDKEHAVMLNSDLRSLVRTGELGDMKARQRMHTILYSPLDRTKFDLVLKLATQLRDYWSDNYPFESSLIEM
jgi:hypothetical protein